MKKTSESEHIRYLAHMLDEAMCDKANIKIENQLSEEETIQEPNEEELAAVEKHFLDTFDIVVEDVLDEYIKRNRHLRNYVDADAFAEHLSEMANDIVFDVVRGENLLDDDEFKEYLQKRMPKYVEDYIDDNSDNFDDDQL